MSLYQIIILFILLSKIIDCSYIVLSPDHKVISFVCTYNYS